MPRQISSQPQGSPSRIYADHAATSFPKAPGVIESMSHYASALGASPGRGGYAEAVVAGRLLNTCRQRLARLLSASEPERLIFTLNCSDSLNLAIHGLVQPLLRRGEKVHLVASEMDHNSILRPLNTLRRNHPAAVDISFTACDPATGRIDLDDLARLIRPETCLVAVQHASNVTGVIQPVDRISAIARSHEVPLLIDAAQTAGHIPIDLSTLPVDLLAMPGHKGLLGPSGTGVLYIAPGMESRIEPLRQGGTGSLSEEELQPDALPDRFESGSHNAVGIVGLSAAIDWILGAGVESLRWREQLLTARVLARLADSSAFTGLHSIGPPDPSSRVAVFSVLLDGIDPQELSSLLEERYGILSRSGLHCAPRAHRLLGTFDRGGATRISFGPFVSDAQVDQTLDALADLCASLARGGRHSAP